MRILFIGDVVGRTGREAVAASLPKLRAALRIDLAVVNAENASHGFGLSPDMAEALFAVAGDFQISSGVGTGLKANPEAAVTRDPRAP